MHDNEGRRVRDTSHWDLARRRAVSQCLSAELNALVLEGQGTAPELLWGVRDT